MVTRAKTATLTLPFVRLNQNPLIPSGISPGCTSYLTSLDSDPQILSWTKSFTSVIANFGVGSNSNNAGASAVNAALNSFCPSVPNFPQGVVCSQLTNFYAACSNELTSSPNADVIRTYDVLYTLLPLSQAVCSKGDDGNYCVLEVGSNNSTGKTRRDNQQVVIPNLQQFKSTNLAFLGIQSSLSSQQLCQTCTRNILTPYIQFTSTLPYGPGISQSLLLSDESDLYQTVQQKCGAPFLSGSVQAAGGISGGVLGSGAADLSVNTRTVAGALSAIIAGFFFAL